MIEDKFESIRTTWRRMSIDCVARNVFNFANASEKNDDVDVSAHISATRAVENLKFVQNVRLATILILQSQKDNNEWKCGCC